MGSDGYAFANVNAVPEINREARTAGFTFYIDPGRRIYVRKVNISGNAKTRDEVIRREVRQLEDAWYDATRIDRSKVRITRLQYFEDVNVETPSVAGSPDQVDLNFTVTEKATGNLLVGVGYSSADGVVLSGSISQNNVFGTGNALVANAQPAPAKSTSNLPLPTSNRTGPSMAFRAPPSSTSEASTRRRCQSPPTNRKPPRRGRVRDPAD